MTSMSEMPVKLSLAIAAFMPLYSAPAYATNTTSLSCVRAIQFGKLVGCNANGHITVTANGLVKTDSCLHPLGTPKQAVCTLNVNLPQTNTLQISMTSTRITLTGAGNIILDQFNIQTENGGVARTFYPGDLSHYETQIGIGGRLNVNGSQAAGTYSGNIKMSVTFP